MDTKRLITMLFLCISILNTANGMEIVKDVVKNEVIPAGLIIGTGTALGCLSESLLWKIHGLSNLKKNVKNGAIIGAICSIPILGAAFTGSRSSRLSFTLKNFTYLSCVVSFSYSCAGLLANLRRKRYEQSIEELLPCVKKNLGINEAFLKNIFDMTYANTTRYKIMFDHIVTYALLSAAIIKMRDKDIS